MHLIPSRYTGKPHDSWSIRESAQGLLQGK